MPEIKMSREQRNAQTKARNEMRREQRQQSAAERQAYWDGLTPAQKLAELDKRLGKGVGAKKQRAKLAELMK